MPIFFQENAMTSRNKIAHLADPLWDLRIPVPLDRRDRRKNRRLFDRQHCRLRAVLLIFVNISELRNSLKIKNKHNGSGGDLVA